MNKTEIQSRIEGVESMLESVQKNQDSLKSILTSLKADLSKCDCTDGIEQEKCWFGVTTIGDCLSSIRRTKEECKSHCAIGRPTYMPECRQVTEQDIWNAYNTMPGTVFFKHVAETFHKLGFRIKVTP